MMRQQINNNNNNLLAAHVDHKIQDKVQYSTVKDK